MLPNSFQDHQFLFQVDLLSWFCTSEPTVLVVLKPFWLCAGGRFWQPSTDSTPSQI